MPMPAAQSSSSSAASATLKGAALSATSSNNAKPKVFNPYARKKSIASSAPSAPADISDPASRAAPNCTSGASTNNGVTNNPYNKPKKRTQERISMEQLPPPTRRFSPPPADKSTTFSQAFGGEDPDAKFGEEELAQQRAFDESLTSTAETSSSTETNNNSINGITPRDNHTILQPHVLHISTRQQGNPIISHIRNVPFKLSTMVPDYIMSPLRCALFLSLRYHNLHPNYIHRRIAELKSDFEYRMLLCYVDIEDNTSPLLFLNDLCVQNNLTLILAWSEEEAARYLETVKAFDGKDASLIQKREHTEHIDQVHHALNSARSVNKTDASQLLNQFGCWRNLVQASADELSVCPGVGPKKVRRLFEAFHRPFSRKEDRNLDRKETTQDKEKTEKEAMPTIKESLGA